MTKEINNLWRYLIGTESPRGIPLTKEMLEKWRKDPYAKFMCIFCNNVFPTTLWYCKRCGEYRGVQPYIPEWNGEV